MASKVVTSWDPDKLTPEQAKIAKMIIEESRRQGVNPDIVLGMAWIESTFDQSKTSKTGARGVMQLTKATAKTYNCDRENLGDNVRCGIKFIDDLLKNKQVGYDPLKLVVAYHDGPSSTYFKTGKADDISKEAVQYAHDFNVLTGGLLNPEAAKMEETPPAEAPPAEAPPAEDQTDELYGSPDLDIRDRGEKEAQAWREWSQENEPKEYGFSPGAMVAGATVGAPTGAALGTTKAVYGAGQGAVELKDAIARAADAFAEGRPGAGPAAPGRGGPLPPAQGPVTRTPAGGQGTFNYAKKFGLSDFDAARAADMSKQPGGSWDVARKVAEAEAKIGPGYRMVPERADLLLPEQIGSGPRGAARAPIPPVEPPSMSPLRRFGQAATQTVLRHPILSGLIGGAGTGAMAAETAERYRTGDMPGTALGAMGTLGSAMSMIPKTAGPGTAMAIASPLTMAITDYIRNRQNQPFTPMQLSEGMLRSLQEVEQGIRANIARKKGPSVAPQEGFSLPVMAP
jgi:hypothetical protein